MKHLTVVVPEGDAGERIDRLLVRHLPGLGRRRTAELFARGEVRVDGKRARKGDRVRTGAIVTALVPEGGAPEPEPEAPLEVVLERDDLVVVNKPAGQATAPLASLERGSLAAALLGRFPEMRGIGHREREPGLVHRLDTQTSGLVLAARTKQAFDALNQALKSGAIEKRYYAIVASAGLPAEGLIDDALGPHERTTKRVTIVDRASPRAHPSETRWRRVEVRGAWALLEVTVHRAYRHQIRAHLAHIGHPIAGDARYGGRRIEALADRHALHASYIAWAGGDTVDGFAVEVPLPADFAAFF